VSQAGARCGLGVTPPEAGTLPAARITASLPILAVSGCACISSSGMAWLSVVTPLTGSRNAPLTYSATPSTDPMLRIGSITGGATMLQIAESGSNPAQQYLDAPVQHPFREQTALLRFSGVTVGCICAYAPTSQGRMAAFVIEVLLAKRLFSTRQLPILRIYRSILRIYRSRIRSLNMFKRCASSVTGIVLKSRSQGARWRFTLRTLFTLWRTGEVTHRPVIS
jgi:hypothetical protein